MRGSVKISGITIFIIILFFVISQTGRSENQKNIEIISKICREKSEQIIFQLSQKKIDSIFVPIPAQESKRFFYSLLVKAADSSHIRILVAEPEEKKKPYLDFSVEIETSYSVYAASGDSLTRSITFQLSGGITDKNGLLETLKPGNRTFTDIIGRDEAEKYNSQDYKFARADIPVKPQTFWSEIVQPVAFIGAAIVTVVLLFTVRSK